MGMLFVLVPTVGFILLPLWAIDVAESASHEGNRPIWRWAGGSLAAALVLVPITLLSFGGSPAFLLGAIAGWALLLANNVMLAAGALRLRGQAVVRGFSVVPTGPKDSDSHDCPPPDRPI